MEAVEDSSAPLPAPLARALVRLVGLLPVDEVNWALTGSVAHRLSGVVVPLGGDIDIQADEAGAYEIQRRLPPETLVEEVWWRDSGVIRSHFGRAEVDGVPVDIMGALQKRRSRSDAWTPPVDPADHRRYVEFEGVTVPVLDLAHEAWAYEMLGRPDRAELLRRAAPRLDR